MSAIRADNVARDLLARLIDETELEAAPLDELRADLALLSIDPARTIRFSREMAEQAASPATNLLAQALAAEEGDREIAALEHAGIDSVRAELSAAVPSTGTQAQRLASKILRSAPQRRGSRRLWYGIGGATAAIAASVLIVVNLSNRVEPQQMAYAPESELSATARGALQEPAAASKSAAPASSAPIAGAADTGTASASNADATSDGAATRFEQQYDAVTGTAATERTREEALEIEAIAANDAAEGTDSFRALPIAESEFADLTVSAALILQPEQAPEPLRQSDLGVGNLAPRLPEVARLPFNQYIVALVTLERADGTTIDGMLYHMPVGHFQALRKADADAPLQENESLLLPESIGVQPTLRQLLGEQAGDFRLSKLKAPAVPGQQ